MKSHENEKIYTWQEYLDITKELQETCNPVFRGQSVATWFLDTTLERELDQPLSVDDYVRLAESVCVESPYSEIDDGLKNISCAGAQFYDLETLKRLVHLRHHGFPSPLLDWTESPLIAASFAFEGASENQDVAIHIYVRTLDGYSAWCEQDYHIIHVTLDDEKNSRHRNQKAQYTIARRGKDFCSHEEVFDEEENIYIKEQPNQNRRVKVRISASEKKTALDYIRKEGFDRGTLFNSKNKELDEVDSYYSSIKRRCFEKN